MSFCEIPGAQSGVVAPASRAKSSYRCRLGALLPVVALVLSGCSTFNYYSAALTGHLEVIQATRPITDLIDDPACDHELKKKLVDVRRMRDFASSDLDLPNNDSYRSYADIKRPFVSWNVFAAPEFSLQTMNWCMLVVGCVGYRGFHDENEARRLASELREQGFDTYVGGVPAYSTLGYSSDPVLNTFMRFGSFEVARIIFHELAHQVVFVAGDTVFNESFATLVENEGLRRWLTHKATPDIGNTVAAQRQGKADFVELVAGYRTKLQTIYESASSAEAKRLAKVKVLSDIRDSYLAGKLAKGQKPVYKEWLELDLNNAKLASLGLYTQLLPGFEALLKADAYDLPRFYRSVAKLGQLSFAERRTVLQLLQSPRQLASTR